jgi:hypothetical protein
MASTSWKDCMNSCESDPRCVAFTYVGGNKGIGSGDCWFKNAKGEAVTAGPNLVAGFLAVKAVAPDSSVASILTGNLAVSSGSSTTSSSTSSTSTASTSWATNPAGTNYTIYRRATPIMVRTPTPQQPALTSVAPLPATKTQTARLLRMSEQMTAREVVPVG